MPGLPDRQSRDRGPSSAAPARVAKLVDAPGLGPDASNGVRVRVRPRAPAHLHLKRDTHGRDTLKPSTSSSADHADAAGRRPSQSEVDSRLKTLARTVKADGFRPGKVPMSVVAQRYGYSVHYEVHERQGRPGLHRGRQRGQAARRRPAADHREGRARPKASWPSTRPSRSTPRSRSATWPAPRSSSVTTEVERRGDRQDARHPAQAAPHLRAAPGGRAGARTATA